MTSSSKNNLSLKPFYLSLPAQGAILTTMLVGLPLAGVRLSGKSIQPYLEFPPLTRYVHHAPFSPWIFGLFAAIDLLMVIFVAYLLIRSYRQGSFQPRDAKRFPAWGWFGLIIMFGGWFLAWTRFSWFAPLQGHTFCLPWIGYIILINALCLWRSGRSLLTDTPKRFPLLVACSALFWWFFEYLNRFVQNWYYTGVDDFSALSYSVFASLAFATVLPAVLGTYRLLLTFPLFDMGLRGILPMNTQHPRIAAWGVLTLSGTGLTLLGLWPDMLFSLLWVSPLLITISLLSLSGREVLLARLKQGDWRPIITAALSALICGFFWELWNIGSLARWHYTIPYVDRYCLFAMPLLGYGGYLPFGPACLMMGSMVVGPRYLLPDDIFATNGQG